MIYTAKDLIKARKLHYKTDFQGLPISVENRKGTYRYWYDPMEKKEGKTKFQYGYGYVRGTRGEDGDQVDVFIGPDKKSPHVFIIRQQDPNTGMYDEDKCMLGFSSMTEAVEAYKDHYDKPDFLGDIDYLPIHIFKEKIKEKTGRIEKAMNRAGLVPKKVSVSRGGRTFQQTVWVKPDTKYADKVKNQQDRRDPEGVEKKTGTPGIAPNGEPSNLSTKQWHEVRTPEFKVWFGDWEKGTENFSNVLDENGEPLVVYHGTDGELDIITPGYDEPGAWFTTSRSNAGSYARGTDARMYSVYLNAREPMVVEFDEQDGELMPRIKGFTEEEMEDLYLEDNVSIVEYADRHNYDSVHFPVGNFTEADETWVVFSSDQIKSAVDNSGSFDPEDPNINKSITYVIKSKKKTDKEKKFAKVMREFKEGTLRSSSGDLVTDRNQALAIAYSESGLSKAITFTDGIMDTFPTTRKSPILTVPWSPEERDLIPGGRADTETLLSLSNKHKVPIYMLEEQLRMGISVEYEHTNNEKIAREIAMDHLAEIPDYYTRLAAMEREGKRQNL